MGDMKYNQNSHNPSWEQKQGMLEYDLLDRKGLIKLTIV